MDALSIHLTDQCNNECRFCVVDSHREHRELVDRSRVRNYLSKHAGKGYDRVNLHGGEPMLVPELLEILETIRSFGYPAVSMQTNARLLADLALAQEVCELGVDLFVISVHGDEATHDYLTTVPGSWQEAVRGLRNVKGLGARVRTNTVVCKQNERVLPELISMILDLDVDHVNLSNLHPAGRAYRNFDLVVPQITGFLPELNRAVDIVAQRGIPVTLEGFPSCVLGDYRKFVIDWDAQRFKLLFREFEVDDYHTFMRMDACSPGPPCDGCAVLDTCGGVYWQYTHRYGWSEFSPLPEPARK